MKPAMILEASGLIMELINKRGRVVITYSACTHGGWAKYIGETNGTSEPTAFFENKSEVISDANSIAKYYNSPLEVRV
jgi:hypothetical protein